MNAKHFTAVCLAAITTTTLAQPTESPFLGTPAQIPGIIQAANFDNGGEGVAWYDTTPGNQGGAYRTNVDVDIFPTTNTATGYMVEMAAGEWLNYTVNVAQTGPYG